MKKYIRANKDIPTGDLYGCYLRDNGGSVDDILVFSPDRKKAIEYGEHIADLFRKATDYENRSLEESDDLAAAIFDHVPDGVYTADDFVSPYSFYMDEDLVVNDASGNTFHVIPARIIRGNYRI